MKNKIEAAHTNIKDLLKEKKFYIDYFQREYHWEKKHIEILVEDLTDAFLSAYEKGDERSKVRFYKNYFLGPVVFSEIPNDGKKSIIDGQQRITSITLLLIYLNHLQSDKKEKVNISELIFSEKYGEKSFNMTDEDRETCLESLFKDESYTLSEKDNETVINLVNRYEDIKQVFPEEIVEKNGLAHFIDWFTENVVLVKITAYSDDNAYTIFETMNDRGLSLNSTEMLKGYVLSQINDKEKRNKINKIWKIQIQKLKKNYINADFFFVIWFRAKYAESIRSGQGKKENQDFENIGTRFHDWFKKNHKRVFGLNSPDDFYSFFKCKFPFYVKWYLKIVTARETYTNNLKHVHYIEYWGIANSLREPLLLSTICCDQPCEDNERKVDLVAKFIKTFTVRRSINYKKFGQASIKYTMFNIIKKIRNNSEQDLLSNLSKEVDNIPQKWEAMGNFRLHGMNRKFVKHLLSRISSYVDNLAGKDTDYVTYHNPNGKPFQIEHIWRDKHEDHKDELDKNDPISDFKHLRNSIGALILIPKGTNQSYNDAPYKDKLKHYLKENTYAQTLHKDYYSKNPNFLNNETVKSLPFKEHSEFKKKDISERTELVRKICENIWSWSS